MKIAPDGNHIVSVSADGAIIRWRMPTIEEKEEKTLEEKLEDVTVHSEGEEERIHDNEEEEKEGTAEREREGGTLPAVESE